VNIEHARLWLDLVLGGLAGWINLRAIHPDQAQPPQTLSVRTTGEALAWCQRMDGHGMNLYAGLARRGELRDQRGAIDGSERNLCECRALWADLDTGTREEQRARIAAFPIRPSLLVDSGGGTHALWLMETHVDCASDPQINTKLRNVLKGIQAVIGGDPAVVDPSRIFRVAGTTNYPNARKRALGRGVTVSSILEHTEHTVVFEDFDDFELRGMAEYARMGSVQTVHGHGESLSPAVEHILTREPRMRRVFYCEERLKDKSASDEDFAIAVGVLRRAPWLLTEDVVAALRYRRIALAHLVKGSEKSAGYFVSTVQKARRTLHETEQMPDFEVSHARWFQCVLARALQPQTKPVVGHAEGEEKPYPRIATSIAELDEATGGGVYGLAVTAGDSGVGKSTLALNVALIAKAAGWDVLYVAAEMDHLEYEARAARYCGTSVAGLRESGAMPTVAHVGDGLELDALTDLILTFPNDRTQRMLVVMDSVTKIAAFVDRAERDGSFLNVLSKLVRLGESAVRHGERRIAVLMTSELNREGAALGRRITYSASLQVNLMQDKQQPDLVQISIAKGRNSSKKAAFGPYMQDWRRHRLARIGARPEAEAREEDRY
jgi:hypothetical protein